MSNPNELNAGASTFTPAGSSDDYEDSNTESAFMEYAEMVDNIEHDMDESDDYYSPPPASNESTLSGLPSHMTQFAREFWFPESRNCTCCQGFKHGCPCVTMSGQVCQVCTPGGSQPVAPAPRAPPQQPMGGNRPVCKFYRSPGGCRFNQNCRFLHI